MLWNRCGWLLLYFNLWDAVEGSCKTLWSNSIWKCTNRVEILMSQPEPGHPAPKKCNTLLVTYLPCLPRLAWVPCIEGDISHCVISGWDFCSHQRLPILRTDVVGYDMCISLSKQRRQEDWCVILRASLLVSSLLPGFLFSCHPFTRRLSLQSLIFRCSFGFMK